MKRFTSGVALSALIAAAAPAAMAQDSGGNAEMLCGDFLALDGQTQGTVLLQVEAQNQAQAPDAGPDATVGESAETTIGGGAGMDGSQGTQSGAEPAVPETGAAPSGATSGTGTTSGGTSGTAGSASPAPGTGTAGGAAPEAGAAPGAMAMPALLDGVMTACRDDPAMTVADAAKKAKESGGQSTN